MSTRSGGVGLSVGASMLDSPTFDAVPFAGFSLEWSSVTFRADDGTSATEAETYGVVGIGLGLVLNRILTLRPSVGIPLGLEDADPSFGITLSLHLMPRS